MCTKTVAKVMMNLLLICNCCQFLIINSTPNFSSVSLSRNAKIDKSDKMCLMQIQITLFSF